MGSFDVPTGHQAHDHRAPGSMKPLHELEGTGHMVTRHRAHAHQAPGTNSPGTCSSWILQGANKHALSSRSSDTDTSKKSGSGDDAWVTLCVHANDASLDEAGASHTWSIPPVRTLRQLSCIWGFCVETHLCGFFRSSVISS